MQKRQHIDRHYQRGQWYAGVTAKRLHVAEDERVSADYGQWYVESIAWVAQRGFMSGLSGTTQMAPYGTTSRAMVVTMLCRVSGGATGNVGSLAFPDVSRNEWYSGTIAWGVQNGLVSGYGDGTFRPDQDVTREEAAILMRYAQMRGLDTSARANLSAYPDDDEVSPWGAQAMSWAVATGIINGENGRLNPQGTAYRCEFAAMLRSSVTSRISNGDRVSVTFGAGRHSTPGQFKTACF